MFSTLGDGGDDLLLKDEVGDLGIAFGDADVALVGGEAESGEQRLRDLHRKIRIQIGIDDVVRRVAGDALAEVIDLHIGAEGKGLGSNVERTLIVLVLRIGTPTRNSLASWTTV